MKAIFCVKYYGSAHLSSHFISSHFISTHFISFRFILSHFFYSIYILSHLISSFLALSFSSHPISSYLIPFHPILSRLISSVGIRLDRAMVRSLQPKVRSRHSKVRSLTSYFANNIRYLSFATFTLVFNMERSKLCRSEATYLMERSNLPVERSNHGAI